MHAVLPENQFHLVQVAACNGLVAIMGRDNNLVIGTLLTQDSGNRVQEGLDRTCDFVFAGQFLEGAGILCDVTRGKKCVGVDGYQRIGQAVVTLVDGLNAVGDVGRGISLFKHTVGHRAWTKQVGDNIRPTKSIEIKLMEIPPRDLGGRLRVLNKKHIAVERTSHEHLVLNDKQGILDDHTTRPEEFEFVQDAIQRLSGSVEVERTGIVRQVALPVRDTVVARQRRAEDEGVEVSLRIKILIRLNRYMTPVDGQCYRITRIIHPTLVWLHDMKRVLDHIKRHKQQHRQQCQQAEQNKAFHSRTAHRGHGRIQ